MFLHLDTAVNTNKINNNPFQCTINLDRMHRGVKRISLSSVEIPISYHTTHSPLNKFTIDSTVFVVQEGSYNDTSVLNQLNNLQGLNGNFLINSDGYFAFVSSSGVRTIRTVSPGDLSYCMGFVSGQSLSLIHI